MIDLRILQNNEKARNGHAKKGRNMKSKELQADLLVVLHFEK